MSDNDEYSGDEVDQEDHVVEEEGEVAEDMEDEEEEKEVETLGEKAEAEEDEILEDEASGEDENYDYQNASEDEEEEVEKVKVLKEKKTKKVTFAKVQISDKKIIKKIIVPDDQRKTSETLSIYELTDLISNRACMIENGGEYYVTQKEIEGLTDSRDIAKVEFIKRRTPLKLQRAIGTDKDGNIMIEEWNVREMTHPLAAEQIMSHAITFKK